MGIAAFIVWQGGLEKDVVRTALFVFLVQFLLNAIWSPIFFGMKSPIAGFIVIVFLWLAICITIILFYHVSPIASFLLMPYILWVSFALVLNAAIVRMN
jgi:tryptophan-rich sensory protein